jgi:hypothetical protein
LAGVQPASGTPSRPCRRHGAASIRAAPNRSRTKTEAGGVGFERDHLVEEAATDEATDALGDDLFGHPAKLHQRLAVDVPLAGVLELVADQRSDTLDRALAEDDDAVGTDAAVGVHLAEERLDLLRLLFGLDLEVAGPAPRSVSSSAAS